MTLAHDDANARLLDLVYGEGTPDERAAIEAHVATCAACQAELASLGDTRARLRTALEDAPVPARAHARILEAATQAAAPVAAAARAAAAAPLAAAAPVRPRAPSSAAGPSFWQRLLGKWTLPTFATVGAVAVVVIASKVFLEPEKTMERGREVAAPAETAAKDELEAKLRANEAMAEKVAEAKGEADKSQLQAEPPPRRFGPGGVGGGSAAFKGKEGARPGLLGGGSLAQRLARSRAGAGAGATGGLDNLIGGNAGGVAAPAAPPPPTKTASRDDSFASPPSGWKERSVAPAPATAPASAPSAAAAPSEKLRKVSKKSVADNALDGLGDFRGGVPSAAEEADIRSESGAGAAPTSLAKKPAPADRPVVAAHAAPAREPAKAEQPQAKSDAKYRRVSKDKGAFDDDEGEGGKVSKQSVLVTGADKLFAARRWSEAVVAYRDLLRRYPDDARKAQWRTRIAQAQTYLAQGASAPASSPKAAKKAVSDEALPATE
jgi:hypothetical protein